MDEFYSLQLEEVVRSKPDTDEQRCRNLIFAIIAQAFRDIEFNRIDSARRFISVLNPTFLIYCELVDIDPQYLIRKFKEILSEKNEFKN